MLTATAFGAAAMATASAVAHAFIWGVGLALGWATATGLKDGVKYVVGKFRNIRWARKDLANGFPATAV